MGAFYLFSPDPAPRRHRPDYRPRQPVDQRQDRCPDVQRQRRQLTSEEQAALREERRRVAAEKRKGGKSNRAIAAETGVSEFTVRKDERRSTEGRPSVEQPAEVKGLDGKSRPAKRADDKALVEREDRIIERQAGIGRKGASRKMVDQTALRRRIRSRT